MAITFRSWEVDVNSYEDCFGRMGEVEVTCAWSGDGDEMKRWRYLKLTSLSRKLIEKKREKRGGGAWSGTSQKEIHFYKLLLVNEQLRSPQNVLNLYQVSPT